MGSVTRPEQRRAETAARTASHPVAGGLALAFAAALVGFVVSRISPLLSPVLVAILLGVVAANAVRLDAWRPGLDLAGKRVLRIGIVLLGLQLSLGAIASLGFGVIVLAVAVVALGVPFGLWCGKRLGIEPTQSLLTACGFSICGAAAVAAAAGVSDARDEEVATSVALVIVFGTLMIPLVALSAALGLDDHTAGVFAGASVHEVAQVVAAGGLVGQGALAVAVVVKLARVLMLAPLITVITVHRRRTMGGAESGSVTLPPFVPLFVVGFVAAVVVRSVVPIPNSVLDGAKVLQTLLLAAAMFALGTGVTAKAMRAAGAAPFAQAALCTACVTALGLGGALLVG